MREGAQRLSASRRTPRIFLLFMLHQGVLTILRLLSGTIPYYGFLGLSLFRTLKLFLRHHISYAQYSRPALLRQVFKARGSLNQCRYEAKMPFVHIVSVGRERACSQQC